MIGSLVPLGVANNVLVKGLYGLKSVSVIAPADNISAGWRPSELR
jgi:hypothetical protein